MSEENVYIGGTSIKIGKHGFINQPKEIIEYIKYLQNQLQQKETIIEGLDNTIENLEEVIKQEENTIKEVREYIEENLKPYSLPQTIKDMRYIDFYKLLEILDKE